MPAATKPVLAINPSALEWHSPAELLEHFRKHSLDQGNCLRKSLSHGVPFTVDGYLDTQRNILRTFRFLVRALIRSRSRPNQNNQIRVWAFGSNMFCVAFSTRTHKVITAYHNHLEYGQHGHRLFERSYPTTPQKEDAFLEWLSRGEDVANSAKVLLGSNVSHEITNVSRLQGFPSGD